MDPVEKIPSDIPVVVIGGGPAGATVSTLLAQGGLAVALFEREKFPRFHIGESLMPQTYWTLKKLGVLEKLRSSDAPVKASVQFFSESGRPSRPFYFFERNPHECSYTWQVERAWFDQMMIDNAREKGVQVHQGAAVREVLFENGRAAGVIVDAGNGQPRPIGATVVVDATGLSSLIARRLGIQRKDPKLVKGAVFAHYENARRDPGIDEGATLVLHTRGNRGWFWYIPLSRNRVSAGVVSATRELFQDRGPPEQVLEEEIRNCPVLEERLQEARRISTVHVLRDFSYRASRCAGEGWVLVGDAFGFLDPIYSSGVLLALKSAEFAAEAILEAFEKRDFSAARLGRYGARLAKGMEAIRKLVYAFYTPDFSFANFTREHPEHRERLIDILIGDVFKDGVTDIFETMKRFCDLPDEIPLEKEENNRQDAKSAKN
ncbi:MAG: NAD(P)/FAD-dependent oxidoreductase [Planctomycetes bacterium]|nr:NAD(P)/FAD-dependent oxidoreductase [Planctomycetota bacterium]